MLWDMGNKNVSEDFNGDIKVNICPCSFWRNCKRDNLLDGTRVLCLITKPWFPQQHSSPRLPPSEEQPEINPAVAPEAQGPVLSRVTQSCHHRPQKPLTPGNTPSSGWIFPEPPCNSRTGVTKLQRGSNRRNCFLAQVPLPLSSQELPCSCRRRAAQGARRWRWGVTGSPPASPTPLLPCQPAELQPEPPEFVTVTARALGIVQEMNNVQEMCVWSRTACARLGAARLLRTKHRFYVSYYVPQQEP